MRAGKLASAADALAFAEDWISAWNDHNLDRVLAHYADGIEFTSPFAIEFAGGDGTVIGIQALREYWENVLVGFPDLRFELIRAVPGVGSVSLVYTSVRDLFAVETFIFDDDGRVAQVHCHYRSPD